MTSLARRAHGAEQMDDDGLDPAVYASVLADLARVNRVTMAHRPTLNFVARAIGDRRRFTLLDVGFGQGDMLRAIGRWAAGRNVEARLIGVDLNPRSAPAARAATQSQAIDFRTGDYRDLAGEGIDLIISSLVAHHMAERELHDFLRFMEEEARLGWMINDLRRARLAHIGFPLLARVMRWHPMVRADGTLSIARSFREEDWRRILAGAGIADAEARIVRRFPFRLCVERTR